MYLKGASGETMEVDTDNRLLVDARSEWLNAVRNGDAYIWTAETYDYDTADTIISVRNDHSTKNLHITKVKLHGDTETEVEIHVPNTTFTPTGTALVGENLNRTIQRTAEATAKVDETGQATQGDVIERVRIKADTDYEVDFGGALILGHDDAVAVDYATDGGEAHISIWGYFK